MSCDSSGSVIIADLFQAKTVKYSADVASWFFQDEAIGKEGMFLPTWRPSTKAVVRPNYNGNQGSSRRVEDEAVLPGKKKKQERRKELQNHTGILFL